MPPRVTGASSAPVITLDPSPFTEQIAPRPLPVTSYGANFSTWSRWNSVDVGQNAGAGWPQLLGMAEAGKPYVVTYSKELADLGQQGELKKITLHYRIDGGPVKKKAIADGSRDLQSGALLRIPAKVDIPATARGEIEYWFVLETKNGQKHYDSDYGKNFHADIAPAGGAVVKFDDLWGEAINGPIKAGETLRIGYDVDRLKQFMYGTWHHGFPTWSIVAFVSFDGKPATELPIVVPQRGPNGGGVSDMIPVEAAIEVPKDAKNVSIWFRGSSYGGSVFGGNCWDSNFGKNYTYDVVP